MKVDPRRFILLLLAAPLAAAGAQSDAAACPARTAAPRQFVFVNRDRARLADPVFLAVPSLTGVQVKYTWAELEPAPGRYDFAAIAEDVARLRKTRKRLWIQLQDVSFDSTIVNVPAWMRVDPRFHGAIAPQYVYPGVDESKARNAGWVARRWDPAVRDRFHLLLAALGRRFDGEIDGINLPETAIDVGRSGALWPSGFTPRVYRDAVIETMGALRRAFPRSAAMQYGNFMPGEWLPGDDAGHLRAVYAEAARLGLAMGAPDLLPTRRGQLAHAYPLLRAHARVAPVGIAVQEGNYGEPDARTGRARTVEELARFASDTLCVRWIFWSTEEPYWSRDVVPWLGAPR